MTPERSRPDCQSVLRTWPVAACLTVSSLWLAVAPCAAQSSGPRRTATDLVPGVSVFVPERWGIVGVTVANPGDAPAEVVSSHYFPGDPDLQFARRLWVPPR